MIEWCAVPAGPFRMGREPHDAFWGARFALVAIPGPLLLRITSRRDRAFSGPTPDLTDFA